MTANVSGATMLQRAFLPFVLAASLIVVTIYYVTTLPLLTAFMQKSDVALLSNTQKKTPENRVTLVDIPILAANPLDQRIVNGAIVARASASGDITRALRETDLLRRLGWRSSSALQNLLWRGGTTGDQALIIDTLDALLRREKLLGQIYPILNIMTLDPVFRDILSRRLAGRPSWRRYYLMSASDLLKPEEIEGRYLVMHEVQRRGDRLTRNEVAPILPKLISIGKSAEAFTLWQAHAGTMTSPLADMHFAAAARPLPTDALPVQFEWQMGSGNGFFVDAGRDEHGSFLSIDWNGRGVPSFASQVTTARAGRYRLYVTGEPPMTAVEGKLGFRLTCSNGTTSELTPVGAGTGVQMQLITAKALPCDYPELQLFGLVQPASSTGTIILRSIRLVRIGG